MHENTSSGNEKYPDPGWAEYVEYSEYENATHNADMIDMFRNMMERANQTRGKAFVMCNTVIMRNGDRALYSPEYEGEIVAIEESDTDDYLILKDVNVMHEEDSPDPAEVLKYTTLYQMETMRITISKIANVSGCSHRSGNDY